MSAAKARAKIVRQEAFISKLLPLAFLLLIFFNQLPFLPFLQGFNLEGLLTGTLFLFVAGAFAFEMQKTRIGGVTNFGTILLAIFVIASLFMSMIFFFELYDFGTNTQIDILVGIYFFAAFVLLAFQASTQIVTGKRATMTTKKSKQATS